jgi:hypothetical protein
MLKGKWISGQIYPQYGAGMDEGASYAVRGRRYGKEIREGWTRTCAKGEGVRTTRGATDAHLAVFCGFVVVWLIVEHSGNNRTSHFHPGTTGTCAKVRTRGGKKGDEGDAQGCMAKECETNDCSRGRSCGEGVRTYNQEEAQRCRNQGARRKMGKGRCTAHGTPKLPKLWTRERDTEYGHGGGLQW